mmetsp:Transcript_34960/g.39856  ORF Transcript_34960/g.39856 Transcript_34960/m.39856 type:complete len:445 (-) Transcript_34960:39-1373(-)|eukprot:CAMPEP_0194133546 /NCGR_PEP_ID=MMETSP0152-20130528/3672_1 /TAXON_ID=1049557 /ORGANISM="Thalassiothrix antarctica, Strain L6-D1" /LENGTH=444 /DNA_ID=CAMNT_0038828873 /DNA_START=158 /DNA_END=1492 /DNA_ORIENTATION=-
MIRYNNKKKPVAFVLSLLLVVLLYDSKGVDGFSPIVTTSSTRKVVSGSSTIRDSSTIIRLYSTPEGDDNSSEDSTAAIVSNDDDDDNRFLLVESTPLKYQGPYPCLGLRFPYLSTSSQRERNITGISLDFVVDTAANINTLNLQVAQELGLEVVGQSLPGMAAAGAIDGADTYLLGDCQLENTSNNNNSTDDDEIEQEIIFMSNLTASALPIAAPTSAGILGLAFLQCFPGGVEFTWGQTSVLAEDNNDDAASLYPTISFHATDETIDKKSSVVVPITPLPVTLLPSIIIKINGVEMPALLDTGSPITVLNHQAAKAAGVTTVYKLPEETTNPFKNIKNNFDLAQAAGRGEVLTLGGTGGQPVYLLKSSNIDNTVSVVAKDGSDMDFITAQKQQQPSLFVGDIPGLAALNGIGVDSPPAVVLGVDILRLRPRMLYRGQQNELYF